MTNNELTYNTYTIWYFSEKSLKSQDVNFTKEQINNYYLYSAEQDLSELNKNFKKDCRCQLIALNIFDGYKNAYNSLNYTKMLYWFQRRRVEQLYENIVKDCRPPLSNFTHICPVNHSTETSMVVELNERFTDIFKTILSERDYDNEILLSINFDSSIPESAKKIIFMHCNQVVINKTTHNHNSPLPRDWEDAYWLKVIVKQCPSKNKMFLEFTNYVGYSKEYFCPFFNRIGLDVIKCSNKLAIQIKELTKKIMEE